MRPTSRTFIAILAALPFAVMLAATAPGYSVVIWLYLALLAILLVMDWQQCLRFDQLAIVIEEPSALYIGQTNMLKVSVTPVTGLMAPDMTVACQVNPILDLAAQKTRVILSHIGEINIPLKPLRRGEAEISEVWFAWTGPLGQIGRAHV